jgi:hypothetical protein
MVVVPEPPAVTVHVVVMVVVMPMVMVVMTMVVMVVTVVMMSSRGTNRERRQAERDGGSQSEQCSASEHGRSLWSYGFVHPHYWSRDRCAAFKPLIHLIFRSLAIHRCGVYETAP